MKIETKFGINHLVKAKYENHDDEGFHAMEVKEITISTCYAGSQVFYHCRHIIAHKEYKGFKKDGDFKWFISHGLSTNNTVIGWHKYREDEIVAASKFEINIVTGNSKK